MIRRLPTLIALAALTAACSPTPAAAPTAQASSAPVGGANLGTPAPVASTAAAPMVSVMVDGTAAMLLDQSVTQTPAADALKKLWRTYTIGRTRGPADAGKLTPGEVYVELTLTSQTVGFSDAAWTPEKLYSVACLYRKAKDKDTLVTWKNAEFRRPFDPAATIDIKKAGDALDAHLKLPVQKGLYGDKDITVEITATLPNADK